MNILCLVFNTRNKINADLQRRVGNCWEIDDGGKLQNFYLWVELPLKHPPKIPVQLQKPPVTKSLLESDENNLGTRKYGFVYPWTNKTLCILNPKIALRTFNYRRTCRHELNNWDVCSQQLHKPLLVSQSKISIPQHLRSLHKRSN